MKTYRIWFNDYSHRQFLETSDPLRYRDYQARSAADALRRWHNHYFGYMAERIEVIEQKESSL